MVPQNFVKNNLIFIDQQLLSQFIFNQTIGKGAYATVKLGYSKTLEKKVAIKIYEKGRFQDETKRRNLRREISILQKLNHPNIIKLYEIIDTSREIYLIMEFIGEQSLDQFIKNQEGKRLTENLAARIFKQIVEAIQYCHQKNIVHRDIKLENILIDKDSYQIKIIDYGFSIRSNENEQLSVHCGTPNYMAPELIQKRDYRGIEVDIWALGIVLFAMLCGRFPFKGVNETDLQRKITRGAYSFNKGISESSKNLIREILRLKPSERISTEEVLSSEWMQINESDQK